MTDEAKILCEIRDLLEKRGYEYKPADTSLFVVSINDEIPQTLSGPNQWRTEIWITNASDKDLYIAPVPDIKPPEAGKSAGQYSVKIAPDDTLIINAHNYAQMHKKSIYGFWDSGASDTSAAMVTEYSLQG
jgi:hypothetical protein